MLQKVFKMKILTLTLIENSCKIKVVPSTQTGSLLITVDLI